MLAHSDTYLKSQLNMNMTELAWFSRSLNNVYIPTYTRLIVKRTFSLYLLKSKSVQYNRNFKPLASLSSIAKNGELTSSHVLSLLSRNSITGAVTPRMLSKQRNSTQFTSRLLSSQITPPELDWTVACTEEFFKYTEMSISRHGKRYFIRSLLVPILQESWHFHVKEFLQAIFQHSIGSTNQATIFSTCRFPFSS